MGLNTMSVELGQYFRQKRVDAGLTQIDLARVFGYSSSQFVSNWERGLCTPPMASMAKLCEVLKIPKKEIVDVLTEEYRRTLEKAVKKSKAR
ncbi:MAG: helix-turn-helix transcriptional regulator [Bdellovibrionales bacterium]|nr:helix-turn-helix transcriptional regulator [Bdellovibrionales bacterium]